MLLTDINYPIFPIRGNRRVYIENGIDMVDTVVKTWQIDNKNLVGNTLAERRFGIEREDRYPLTVTIFNISQLLNYKKSNKFIDSLGHIFKYKKTRYEKLTYHKVIGKTDIGEGVYAVYVEEYASPFYVSYALFNKVFDYDTVYIGLLGYHGGQIVYELTTEKKENTRRKV